MDSSWSILISSDFLTMTIVGSSYEPFGWYETMYLSTSYSAFAGFLVISTLRIIRSGFPNIFPTALVGIATAV